MLVATVLENIVGQDEIHVLENIVGQDEIPVLEDGNVTITPELEGDVAKVAAVTTSVAVEIVAITWSQNLFAVEVDTPEMPSNIGTTLEDVVGAVVLHLVAVTRDVSARDALETNWDLHEEDDVTVTLHRDAFYMATPLANVVGDRALHRVTPP